MFRRILRAKFKLVIVLAVVAALVVIAKKLMGGLGPEPGSELAPKEWPSLVPDPPATGATVEAAAPEAEAAASTNGDGAATADEGADATE